LLCYRIFRPGRRSKKILPGIEQ